MLQQKITVAVSFLRHTLTQRDFGLVEGDYNSTKLIFEFEENIPSSHHVVFKMSNPQGKVVLLDEVVDGEITLVGRDDEGNACTLFNEAGLYPFELTLYSQDSKLTSAPGWLSITECQVRDGNGEGTDYYIPLLDKVVPYLLPSGVSTVDNGKIMQVVDGKWQLVDAQSGNTIRYDVTQDLNTVQQSTARKNIGAIGAPLIVEITENENGTFSASHATTAVYNAVNTFGRAVYCKLRGNILRLASPPTVVAAKFFGFDGKNCVTVSLPLIPNGKATVEEWTLEEGNGANTLIVKYDERDGRASRTAGEIYQHVSAGGTVVFQRSPEECYALVRSSDYYAAFMDVDDEGFIYVRMIADDGALEEYEYYAPTHNYLMELNGQIANLETGLNHTASMASDARDAATNAQNTANQAGSTAHLVQQTLNYNVIPQLDALESRMDSVEASVGDISAVFDELHTYAQNLVNGGDAE